MLNMDFLINAIAWFDSQHILAQLLMIALFLVFQAIVTFVFWASGLGVRIVSPLFEGVLWLASKLRRKHRADANEKYKY